MEAEWLLCSLAARWNSLCLRVHVCVGVCYRTVAGNVCLITAKAWSNSAHERVNTSPGPGTTCIQTKTNSAHAYSNTHISVHSLFLPMPTGHHSYTLRLHRCVRVSAYLHCHFKLVKPLLLQLSGLKKEFKACVPLLVSHVEPVAPLWRSGRRQQSHWVTFSWM